MLHTNPTAVCSLCFRVCGGGLLCTMMVSKHQTLQLYRGEEWKRKNKIENILDKLHLFLSTKQAAQYYGPRAKILASSAQ